MVENHPSSEKMENSNSFGNRLIKAFSNKTITGTTTPYEVTKGLHILGVPIGSSSFCKDFIKEQVHKMRSDADLILTVLDDPQTQLQLFKTCTTHKLTHLYLSLSVFPAFKSWAFHFQTWKTWRADREWYVTKTVSFTISDRDHDQCHGSSWSHDRRNPIPT